MRASLAHVAALGTIAILVASAGCSGPGAPPADATETAPASNAVRDPEHVVVVIDLSTSITGADRARFQQLLTSLVDSLSFDDELVAFVAHEAGRKEQTPTKVHAMPSARNRTRPSSAENTALRAARNFTRASLQDLLKGDPVPGTDLFASLHTAADYARGAGIKHRTMILLSDMLQCTRTECMEPPRPPFPRSVVDKQVADSIIPDLKGACVSAVGPDPSTKHGNGVRNFWKSYFEAAGAEFSVERYRQIVTQAGLLRCR